MSLFYHPLYSALDLPPHHRFPIQKYRLLYQRVVEENLAPIQTPVAATKEQLALCHDPDYIAQFIGGTLDPKAQKRIGFPWSETLVERTLYSVGASISAAKAAMETGIALQIGGGYHHAFSDHGSGYCIFNDLAVAARALKREGLAERIVLLDLDVHQGDGSAEILKDDPDIITCSLHCESNFPRIKQTSDYDFALPPGTGDDAYLETLEQALNLVTRLHSPDIILYNAGADIYRGDELGQFDVTLAGVFKRDSTVMAFCRERALPLCCALGGGYQRDIERLIEVHWQLFRAFAVEYSAIPSYNL